MEISVVINQVVILFLIILVGFYARKRNIITVDLTDKLSNLLLQITQPMMILSSFDFELSKGMLKNAVLMLTLSFLIHFFSMLVGKFLYRRFPEQTRNVLKYVAVFSNCGFMGFPILYSIFGSIGVFYGALYVIPFNILILSYGIVLFTGKSDKDTLKKIVTHPIIISVVAGMILFLLQIKLPQSVSGAISMIGSMTSPLSMLIVGSLLASIPVREIFRGREVYIGSIVRLIVLPLMVYGLLSLFPLTVLPKEIFQVCVILPSMPAAANTAIIAERYGGDTMLASRLTITTTIFSIFTIPIILLLL